MASFADVRVASPPSLARRAGGLVRWLCTSNPFYVLSAALFLGGLWVSFGTLENVNHIWGLMAGLAGYTLLLAVTACLLVRFGNVWDDVRTVLLLVVLMFLATSVTFDMILAFRDNEGMTFYLAGLVFAIGVSEALLHGIRLRLPALFRIPYYLILALFFLYPLALNPFLRQPDSDMMRWGLFGFSSVAGLAFLTLLPAIRQGPAYLRDNGSPWAWPFYPWALFGLLACAVPARAFLLCWSMHFLDPYARNLMFGPYFLVPFGLAIAVLLLEIGLVSRRRWVISLALTLPLGLILLTLVGHRSDKVYAAFLETFTNRLGGDPLYVTLVALVLCYAYAALRRVHIAFDMLSAVLAALAVVGPDTLNVGKLVPLQAVPIFALGALQLSLGIARRGSWRCLVGGAGLATAAALVLPDMPEAAFYRGALAFHLSLTTVLVVGAAFDSLAARLFRFLGAALVLAACLDVVFYPSSLPSSIPWGMITAYPPAMAAIILMYGLVLRHWPSMLVSGVVLVCWLVVTGWGGYSTLRKAIRGLDWLAISLVVFVQAVLTSLAKSGLLAQLWKRCQVLLACGWKRPAAEMSRR